LPASLCQDVFFAFYETTSNGSGRIGVTIHDYSHQTHERTRNIYSNIENLVLWTRIFTNRIRTFSANPAHLSPGLATCLPPRVCDLSTPIALLQTGPRMAVGLRLSIRRQATG